MEKLIYGTERGYLVIRNMPFFEILKKINISTSNVIQPVLTFIVSKDRRFLLVGCGEGGLTVVTEPFSSQQSKQRSRQVIQGQTIQASKSNSSSTQVTLASGSAKSGQTNTSFISAASGFNQKNV